MRYQEISNNLFIKNRNKLSKLLKKDSVAVFESNFQILRNGDQYYKYRQNSDLFYLTGINQENTYLIVYPEKSKKEAVLFITKTDKKTEIWEGHKLTKQEASEISGINENNIIYNDEIDKYIKLLSKEFQLFYLQTTEEDNFIPKTGYGLLKKILKHKNIKTICSCKLMQELRLVKEPEEIELIKKAVEITKSAYIKTLKTVKPEKKEYEIEAEIIYEFIKNGAGGHAYEPIIASGKNACTLHYVNNDSVLKNDDLLLMDFGAEYANYAADLSRTIPVNGKFTKRQKEIYNAVLDVQKKAINLYVPGNTINYINSKVEKWIEEKLIELSLFSKKDVENQDKNNPLFKKYYMHGVAHFLGLDVHDIGAKYISFKKNMVLTCEPGIYIEEEGIGIRIENDIIVDDNPIDLMKNFPVESGEIEEIMN